MEDLRAASGGEGIQLEVELLVIRGHAGIPNFHPRPRPSWALGSLSPFATAFCNTHALIKSRPSPHPFLCGERDPFCIEFYVLYLCAQGCGMSESRPHRM